MGVKAIEEKYKVKHIVQLREAEVSYNKYELCLCIGSAYIPECIVVNMQGKIVKGGPERSNAELNRYFIELKQDEGETLKALINQQDVYTETVPVYTFDDGRVIKKYAEAGKIGFPHTFTDGRIMYENTTFTDIAEARIACKKDSRAGIKSAFRTFKEAWAECAARLYKVTKYVLREAFYYLRSHWQ
jgi:hypothetical protein